MSDHRKDGISAILFYMPDDGILFGSTDFWITAGLLWFQKEKVIVMKSERGADNERLEQKWQDRWS